MTMFSAHCKFRRPRSVVVSLFVLLLIAWPLPASAHPVPIPPVRNGSSTGNPSIGAQQAGPIVNAAMLGSSPSIYLNTWRFHIGDAPAAGGIPSWAQPGFDDTQWPVVSTDKTLAAQGFTSGFPGFCWYRVRIQVPAHANLSVYLSDILSSYEVFEDGVKVGGVGGLPPHEARYNTIASAYALPSLAQPATIVLAVRVWGHPMQSPPGISPDSSFLGHSSAIADMRQHYLLDRFHLNVQTIVDASVELVMGFVLLVVFLGQRTQREWLWLGLAFLAGSVAEISGSFQRFSHLRIEWGYPIQYGLNYLGLALSVSFICAFVGVRPNRWLRGFQGLLLAAMAVSFLNAFIGLPLLYVALIYGQFLGVFGMLTLGVLLYWFVRGNREAGVLLLPFALTYIDSIAIVLGAVAFGFGLQHTPEPHSLLPNIPIFGEGFDLGFLLSMLWLIAILFILLQRSTQVSRDKQQLVSELEAARTVQTLVLSRQEMATPGFVVESSYQPAQQVGGDFFLVSPGIDGSLILVLGDVSGKGLAAAMRVSLILGALRRESSRSPAEILKNLNSILCGQIDGFVTCMAAHVTSDGALTLANAGHLSPYLNGVELALENGLPLGIDPAGQYAETQFHLAAADKLTVLSDGVVEARSISGELYGFQRTQAVSRESAQAITQAAQAFGPTGHQDDDITVVTVALKPQLA